MKDYYAYYLNLYEKKDYSKFIKDFENLCLNEKISLETFDVKLDINLYYLYATIYKDYGISSKNNKYIEKSIYLYKILIELYYKVDSLHQDPFNITYKNISRFYISNFSGLISNYTHSITSYVIIDNYSNIKQSIIYSKEILLLDINNPKLYYNLGNLYRHINNYQDAIANYLLCLEFSKHTYLDAYIDLIIIFKILNDGSKAIFYIKKGLNYLRNNKLLYKELGVIYALLKDFNNSKKYLDLSYKYYENRFDESTIDSLYLSNLYIDYGFLYSYFGDFNKATYYYNKALKYNNTNAIIYQNLLLNFNYFDFNDDYFTLIKNYSNELYKIYNINMPLKIKNKSNKKLRIGYVSGDFNNHAVSYFLFNILNNYDCDYFEIYCYCNSQISKNNYSNKIIWKNILNVNTGMCLNMIFDDNIDILIDLSGHTASNRLDIFYNIPSNTIKTVSFIGYPSSLGTNKIQYRIFDKYIYKDLNPQKFFTEKLIYFENNAFVNYTNPFYIRPNIIKNNNIITFGSFNKPNKINKSVISVWTKLLQSNSNYRILLKGNYHEDFIKSFDISVQKQITILKFIESYTDHMNLYKKIDIALDTWPYSGTTTTCESLYCNVPVITLKSNKFNYAQNVSASILHYSNLDELICYTEDEYIDKIIFYTNNLKDLLEIKNKIYNNLCSTETNKNYNTEYYNLLKSIHKK